MQVDILGLSLPSNDHSMRVFLSAFTLLLHSSDRVVFLVRARTSWKHDGLTFSRVTESWSDRLTDKQTVTRENVGKSTLTILLRSISTLLFFVLQVCQHRHGLLLRCGDLVSSGKANDELGGDTTCTASSQRWRQINSLQRCLPNGFVVRCALSLENTHD